MTVRAHCQVTTFDVTTNAVMTAATVNVYTPGTVTPISATIYDRLGNPLSNPLTSDATTGLCDFYLLVAQEVDLVVSKASFTTRTYSNVPVLDDSSLELTALLTTTGDIAYASSANTPARLPIGTNNNVMYVAASVPAYNSLINVNSSGALAVGATITAGQQLAVGGSGVASSGNITYGVVCTTVGDVNSTTDIFGVYSRPTTAATSFTCTEVDCFRAAAPTKGAGSTITTLTGVSVEAMTNGGTNNYGIYVNTPSGGSGDNGNVLLGDTAVGLTTEGSILATSATVGFLWIPICNGTPTGVPARNGAGLGNNRVPIVFDVSANKLWAYDAAWKGVALA